MDLYISHLERQNEAKRLALPEPRLTSAEYREAHAKGVAEGRAIVDSWRRQPSTQGFVFSDLNAQDTHHARQTAFRIYTERRDNLAHLTAQHVDGATIIDTIGIWQGQTELSSIIEVLAPSFHLPRILALADNIRRVNAQQSVLVSYRDNGIRLQTCMVDGQ